MILVTSAHHYKYIKYILLFNTQTTPWEGLNVITSMDLKFTPPPSTLQNSNISATDSQTTTMTTWKAKNDELDRESSVSTDVEKKTMILTI